MKVGCRNPFLESGPIVTGKNKTMERCALDFKEILNKQNASDGITNEVQTTSNDITEGEEVPTLYKVQKAIRRLRNNREPGEDRIVADLIKYGKEPREK